MTMSKPLGGVVWCSVGGGGASTYLLSKLSGLFFDVSQNLSPQNYLNFLVATCPFLVSNSCVINQYLLVYNGYDNFAVNM